MSSFSSFTVSCIGCRVNEVHYGSRIKRPLFSFVVWGLILRRGKEAILFCCRCNVCKLCKGNLCVMKCTSACLPSLSCVIYHLHFLHQFGIAEDGLCLRVLARQMQMLIEHYILYSTILSFYFTLLYFTSKM